MKKESRRKISLAVFFALFLCLCGALGYVLGAYTSSHKSSSDSSASSASAQTSAATTSTASTSSSSAPQSSSKDSGTDAASSAEPASTSSAPAAADGSSSSEANSSQASSSADASSSKAQASASSSATSSAASSGSSAPVIAEDPPARDELVALLGEDVANKLIANAKKNADAAWIAAHPSAYDIFRPYIQVEALTVAANEPLAAAFIRGMPEHANVDTEPKSGAPSMQRTSPSPDVPDTVFPHLYQWDQHWGYTPYDGDPFGMSGCGPASLAMVYQGLTGKSDLSPYDMGQIALAGGFVGDLTGTNDGYFYVGAEQVGLRCEALLANADSMRTALSEGRPLIVHVGPGAFSQVGHYFVVAGMAKNGMAIVNDPYSVERSSQLWEIDQIANEAITLYAYSLAE